MRRLPQFTCIALIVCVTLVPDSASGQNRVGLEVIAGVTRPAMESDLGQWTYGPSIGIGSTFAVFPAVTNTPTLDVSVRAVYHHLTMSRTPHDFALPRIPVVFWTTGNPLQSFELSSQLELLLGGRSARVSPIISIGGGVSWMRLGEVHLHYEGDGWQYEGRARESRRDRHVFFAPGVGATGQIFGHRVTAEARATVDGDRRLMLIPLNLRIRL